MPGFIKVVDHLGHKSYLNPDHIISFRPNDHDNFKSSGVALTVARGTEVDTYVIPAGTRAELVLQALGVA